jgi:hypothetical protein
MVRTGIWDDCWMNGKGIACRGLTPLASSGGRIVGDRLVTGVEATSRKQSSRQRGDMITV